MIYLKKKNLSIYNSAIEQQTKLVEGTLSNIDTTIKEVVGNRNMGIFNMSMVNNPDILYGFKKNNENIQKVSNIGNYRDYLVNQLRQKEQTVEQEIQGRKEIKEKRDVLLQNFANAGVLKVRIEKIKGFLENYNFMKWAKKESVNFTSPEEVEKQFKIYIEKLKTI